LAASDEFELCVTVLLVPELYRFVSVATPAASSGPPQIIVKLFTFAHTAPVETADTGRGQSDDDSDSDEDDAVQNQGGSMHSEETLSVAHTRTITFDIGLLAESVDVIKKRLHEATGTRWSRPACVVVAPLKWMIELS
jgi:hypothetical protein